MFVSAMPSGVVKIHDKNLRSYRRMRNADGVSATGLVTRDYGADPIASKAGAKRFPRELLIDPAEYKERIEERERTGKRLVDRILASKLRFFDQSPSWYCWCYSTVHGVMASEISQNNPPRGLCPESVAGPIMHYRKEGGYCSLALAYIVEQGVADVSVWPHRTHHQANNPSYFDGSRANAGQTKVTEWWDLESWEEKISCLLHGFPVPSCYDDEGHARCSVDAIIDERGRVGCLDVDSYYLSSGAQRLIARYGSAAHSSDTVCIRSTTPNNLPATA